MLIALRRGQRQRHLDVAGVFQPSPSWHQRGGDTRHARLKFQRAGVAVMAYTSFSNTICSCMSAGGVRCIPLSVVSVCPLFVFPSEGSGSPRFLFCRGDAAALFHAGFAYLGSVHKASRPHPAGWPHAHTPHGRRYGISLGGGQRLAGACASFGNKLHLRGVALPAARAPF